jgi:predicted Fe-Mo cluster-binding NifX family protein
MACGLVEVRRMRLAISIWNDRISPVFDAADHLLLIDIEQGQERGRQEEVLSDAFPSRRMRRLTEMGVNALICGGISRPLVTLLAESGISVCPWTAGPVDEVLRAYLEDRLHDPQWRMPGCGGPPRGSKGSARRGSARH